MSSSIVPVHDPAANRLAAIQMVACTFFWGGFFVFGKLAVHEAGPIAVAALRFAVAGVLLVALMIWREPASLKVARKDWPLALGLGLSGVTAYNALSFLGFAHAPATDGAMISPTLNPVLTAGVAALIFREPLTRNRLSGIATAIAGTALIFAGPLLSAHAGPERLLGDGYFTAAAVTWSAYTLLGKYTVGRFSPLASTTYASLAGLLFLLPLAAPELAHVDWARLSWTFWGSVLGLAALCTVASFLCLFSAIRVLGPARTASFNFLVPVFGVVMSIWALNERPAPLQIAGMALSLVGVWLVNRLPRPS